MAEDSSAMKFMLQVLVEAQQAVAAAAEIRKLGNEFRKAKTEADSMEAAAEKAAAKSASRGKRQTEDAKEHVLVLQSMVRNIRDTSAAESAGLDPIKWAFDLKKKALEVDIQSRKELTARNQEAANATMSEREGMLARMRDRQSGFRLPTLSNEAARQVVATEQGMERAARATQRSAGMFGMAAGTAANSGNRSRYVMFQLTSAFQDFAVVLQNGGNVERALLGASNNFGVLASAAGGMWAVLGTGAVIAIPTLVGAMMSGEQAASSYADKIKRLTDRVREMKDANAEAATSFRDIAKAQYELKSGLGTKEEIEGKESLKGRISEIARERFDRSPEAEEDVRKHVFKQESEKLSAEEKAVARIKEESLSVAAAQYAEDLSKRITRTAEGLDPETGRARSKIPTVDKVSEFINRGMVDKILRASGMADPAAGGWPDLGMSRGQKGVTDIAVPYRPGSLWNSKEAEDEAHDEVARKKKILDLTMKAVDRAARDPEIAKMMPKELEGAIKNYTETLKKTSERIEADRAKLGETVETKTAGIMHGTDVTALHEFLGDAEFAKLSKAAMRRGLAEIETKRLDEDRKFQNAERDKGRRDEITHLQEQEHRIQYQSPAKKRLQDRIQALESAEQLEHRVEEARERGMTHLREQGKLVKEGGDLAKAGRDLPFGITENMVRDRGEKWLREHMEQRGLPTEDAGKLPVNISAKSEAEEQTRILKIIASRDPAGLATELLKVQQKAFDEIKMTNDLLQRVLTDRQFDDYNPALDRNNQARP